MTTFLSDDIQRSLDAARQAKAKRKSKHRLVADNTSWPILRMWDSGFALAQEDAPKLRGFVDIYDADAHLFQCLIVASEVSGSEVHCTFKRITAIRTKAALDFEAPENAPIALIPHMQ